MNPRQLGWLLAFCVAGLTAASTAFGEHRAVRLGHPSTRFAPPLSSPEQLRALLTERRMHADVESILQQVSWPGDIADLRRAAATAEISEVKLPTGTRMPYMSARKDGRPVALIDVLWVGEEPIDAYAFEFQSRGRRYRCVTPRPCSNFYLVDLGQVHPSMELVLAAPAEVSVCDMVPVSVVVRNTGGIHLPLVRVTQTLPSGLKTMSGQTSLSLDAGDLAPGASRQFTYEVFAARPGTYTSRAQATSEGRSLAEASATTTFRNPVLAIECNAPAVVTMGSPVEVCLDVQNIGDGSESKVTIVLPLPEGARVERASAGGVVMNGQVVWEITSLQPGARKQVCATISTRTAGPLALEPGVRGACALPAVSRCVVQVGGMPAILFEVVDLEDPVEVGSHATYVIKVVNQGTAAATGIRLVCTLEETQEFVSGTGRTLVSAQGRTITMGPVPVLEPKAEASWQVVVMAAGSGDVRFNALLTTEQSTNPIEETEATRQY